MSTFPPARTATTFFPTAGFFEIKYAKLAAPAGSTTNFILSISRNIAFVISTSSTRTISSMSSLIIVNVSCPGTLTEIPSAIVLSPPLEVIDPCFTESYMDGNDFDCTPITLICGFFSCRFAVRFGGHRFAGGFTLSHDEVHTLEENLLKAHQNLPQLSENKSGYTADARLSLDDVNWGMHRLIEPLSPFGLENPKPVFLFENISVEKIKHFGKNGQLHLSLEFLNSQNSRVSAIGFFMKKEDFSFPIEERKNVDLVASLEKSMFRGFPELRLRIIDVLPSIAVS